MHLCHKWKSVPCNLRNSKGNEGGERRELPVRRLVTGQPRGYPLSRSHEMPVDVARVMLWGEEIGAVAWDDANNVASFEYLAKFQRDGTNVAPFMMPLGSTIYTFPDLARNSFYGLPGMLADSLPDKFGNLLIDEWLIREGRDPKSFSPVERLCYVGTRGIGALEYQPAVKRLGRSKTVEIEALVELAQQALDEKKTLQATLGTHAEGDEAAMRDILRVGTSAGGARAKAIIAWNETTGEIRTGQVTAPPGFTYWIIKFDGISGNKDKDLEDPKGFGMIEYAYYLMANSAGVLMPECRLYPENNRHHFVTRRFDRSDDGEKNFMQSLCALGHFDFNQAGAYSYEQAFDVGIRLPVSRPDIEQLFRRMVFNVLSRNQDDHTKNIAFLMDRNGNWTLSPAYDVTFAYNPTGNWTSQHQMTINGKRDGFVIDDFRTIAKRFKIGSAKRVNEILRDVDDAIARWPDCAEEAGVNRDRIAAIQKVHRRLSNLHPAPPRSTLVSRRD
jgi:serine/threonine-protein kinase HipA